MITAEDIVAHCSRGKSFVSSYGRKRSYIGQSEFEKIASAVLDNSRYVNKYSFYNCGVRVMIKSRSGRSDWQSNMDFDDGGRITGKYRYSAAYRSANEPYFIAKEISNRIRSALYD